MHTIDLYQWALRQAEQLGYDVRHENLGGIPGGSCIFRGRKILFVDLASSPAEQLEQLTAVLRHDPGIHMLEITSEMKDWVLGRRAA